MSAVHSRITDSHDETMIELLSVDVFRSPLLPESLRFQGRLRWGSGTESQVWFDLPESAGAAGLDRGEAWLALLLPCAVVAGDDLTIPLPVDPMLLDRVHDLQLIWSGWYAWAHQIGVTAPVEASPAPGSRSAMFFSGGLDSHFTLLRSLPCGSEPVYPRVDRLITVWGFDVPLDRPDEFAHVRTLTERTAERFGKAADIVATNIKSIPAIRERWGYLSHGPTLAAVAHLFGDTLSDAYIASSHDYRRMMPWGSHALSDPLLSAGRTRITYDGAGWGRVAKARRVFSDPRMAPSVRVCWRERQAGNCSRCNDCLHTMATLDLLGLRDVAVSFDWSQYSLEAVSRALFDWKGQLAPELRDYARAHGSAAMQRAIESNRERWMDWRGRIERLDAALRDLIPDLSKAILIDEDRTRRDSAVARRLRSFPERNGRYWGPPADGRAAVAELERQRQAGAEYVAIAWPAFWWRTHYGELASYLEAHAGREHEDDVLVVYRLNRPERETPAAQPVRR